MNQTCVKETKAVETNAESTVRQTDVRLIRCLRGAVGCSRTANTAIEKSLVSGKATASPLDLRPFGSTGLQCKVWTASGTLMEDNERLEQNRSNLIVPRRKRVPT